MRYLLFACLLLFALDSCRGRRGVNNDYADAKTHASETIAKEHKRAAKKADKDFRRQQKKNQKDIAKKGKDFKKKKH